MTTKAKLFLAKLLIVFSVVFIFLGVYLQFGVNKLMDPKKDVTVVAGADETVSVTPGDKDNISEELPGETKPVVTPTPNPEKTPWVTETPFPNISITPSRTPIATQTPVATPVPTPVATPVPVAPQPTPSVSDTNIKLRANLENTYGIKIKYGDEIANYSVGGMSTTKIDDATAQVALNNLAQTLALYPSEFFQEIEKDGYPLTIYLIKRYSKANVTGVTDSTYKNVIISIATDYPFADTLHHEVYHYVEKYMFSNGGRFTSWGTLNPLEFKYGSFVNSYAYSRTFSEDAFFVNTYAQTDEYEDRASTFEYMMMNTKASCLNKGKTVWLKAKTMSEQIDYFFDSVSGDVTEYWERYVY